MNIKGQVHIIIIIVIMSNQKKVHFHFLFIHIAVIYMDINGFVYDYVSRYDRVWLVEDYLIVIQCMATTTIDTVIPKWCMLSGLIVNPHFILSSRKSIT